MAYGQHRDRRPLVNKHEFIAAVRAAAPALTEQLEEDHGLFSLQVGTFARHAQSLIDTGERTALQVCFSLIEQALRAGDSTVVNALGVAFLEHLNFTDGKCHRSWAVRYLQPQSMATLRALGRCPAGDAG